MNRGGTITNEEIQQVQALAKKRAALTTPAERIAFDNDPANGSTALRIVAMLTEPER